MLIRVPEISAAHGFFGRAGGVSTGLFSSLNCRLRGAERDEIMENRRRACTALGGKLEHLRILSQMHTNTVITVTNDNPLPDDLVGDALVSNQPNLILGVLTADCAPVLLHDPVNKVIGAVHSGWRGTAGTIVGEAVAAMCDLGAARSQIIAVIGPCIAPDNYEVGDDVRQAMLAVDPSYATFFRHVPQSGNTEKFYFNLPGLILQQLKTAGVKSAHWTGHDTYALEADYFSCRRATHRAETGFGLQLSALSL
jgi:YfiH family protein